MIRSQSFDLLRYRLLVAMRAPWRHFSYLYPGPASWNCCGRPAAVARLELLFLALTEYVAWKHHLNWLPLLYHFAEGMARLLERDPRVLVDGALGQEFPFRPRKVESESRGSAVQYWLENRELGSLTLGVCCAASPAKHRPMTWVFDLPWTTLLLMGILLPVQFHRVISPWTSFSLCSLEACQHDWKHLWMVDRQSVDEIDKHHSGAGASS
mmetsp:Transcript_3499/g.7301  ORF Transcript_3499/g.7301 Transcript_3499/m.7301 type:complete len:211 (-) Transcript_3499:12-644(-)